MRKDKKCGTVKQLRDALAQFPDDAQWHGIDDEGISIYDINDGHGYPCHVVLGNICPEDGILNKRAITLYTYTVWYSGRHEDFPIGSFRCETLDSERCFNETIWKFNKLHDTTLTQLNFYFTGGPPTPINEED